MRQARGELRAGALEVSPLAAGVAIYGLAFGLLAAQAGMTGGEVGIMGLVVYAGASQIVAVERLAAAAGPMAAIVAGMALNLRLFLITASVRDIFAQRSWWQILLGAHLTGDENWALTVAARNAGREIGYHYLLGAGLLLITAWICSGVLGSLFAGSIPEPETFGIDFAFSAAFIAIARSLWRGKSDLLPWALSVAVVAAILRFDLAEPSWAIVLGGLAGAFLAGYRKSRAERPAPVPT